MAVPFVTLADIEAARARIAGDIVATPTVDSPSLSERFGVPVRLKLEHRQTTGAFKLRGASNAVALLSDGTRGVTAASTGNHGRALSLAAGRRGIPAVICMSRLVPENKLVEIRRLGAEARIVGASQDEAQVEAERLVAHEGFVMVPPFDDPAIVAGQGTLGLEIVEQTPDVETVLIQVSGGGLASGVAAAVKALRPNARIVGSANNVHGRVARSVIDDDDFVTLTDLGENRLELIEHESLSVVRRHTDGDARSISVHSTLSVGLVPLLR